MTAATEHPYEMVISRMTIDKLGIKLYDRVSAVVAELIANAYDADAEHVTVVAPLGVYLASKAAGQITDKGLTIRVIDDGHGMTPEEVNAFYLQVGRDRRQYPNWGARSREKERPVMGRKGIGKLAPFGICREIEVTSSGGERTRDGYLTAHLILRYEDIVQDTDEPYYPDVGEHNGTYRDTHGTEILLRKFAYRRIPDAETFHRQLAARFGIARPDWQIVVQDASDCEASFTVGDLEIATLDGTLVRLEDRPVELEDDRRLPVSGWVAYSRDSYRDETMAGVRIYARGKIVSQTRDFSLRSGFTGEYKLRSYVVGEIDAEWLDDDDGEDLIRSDRQDILWNSEEGQALRKWGQDLLRELAARAETSLRGQIWEQFLAKSNIREQVTERFQDQDLRNQVMAVARILVSRTDRAALNDQDYVVAITRLAFAFAPHRVLVDRLREVASQQTGSLELVVKLFNTARVAEMYALGQVAFERVSAIERLRDRWIVEANELDLQRIVESAPWLINPEWTQLSANQTLETFRRSFQDWYLATYKQEVLTTTIGYPTRRPDFVLLNFRGKVEAVEIKAPHHSLMDEEFVRLFSYYNALKSFLNENPEFGADFAGGVHVTLVCDNLSLTDARRDHFYSMVREGRLDNRTWQEFLAAAQRSHRDFLAVIDQRAPGSGV